MNNLCPICGNPIPKRKKGNRHGHPPKTCSEACRKERHRRRERARYHEVKDTSAWRDTRRAYLEKLKARLADDPDFLVIFRARASLAVQKWRARIKKEDPSRYAEMKLKARKERAAWRARLVSDAEAWDAYKAKCRAWYASLTPDERERIFYAPRRSRRSKNEKQDKREKS